MKMIFLTVLSIPTFASFVSVTNDGACSSGFSMSSIRVSIDGSSHSFYASCENGLSSSFTTNRGVNCRIDAGMCSNFYPYHGIQVRCNDGSSGSSSVFCPL